VIITSYLFPSGAFSQERLDEVLAALGGDKEKLVIDLSCRRKDGTWFVAMNKWQDLTDMEITEGKPLTHHTPPPPSFPPPLPPANNPNNQANPNPPESIKSLEPYTSEFLIHAADNEGLQRGIDTDLVRALGSWCSIPVTYAGGGRSIADLELVKSLSGGKVDLTIGSALDCFGGALPFEECVAWNRKQEAEKGR
jgi:phosphoribosylformimino-5-aminoimidazole carboxamide ribotide isomerase